MWLLTSLYAQLMALALAFTDRFCDDEWAEERSCDMPDVLCKAIEVVEMVWFLFSSTAGPLVEFVWTFTNSGALFTRRTFVTLLCALLPLFVFMWHPWGVYAVVVAWSMRLLWPRARIMTFRFLWDKYHRAT